MEIILSAAIGGDITSEIDGAKIIHSSIIKMRKSLKQNFAETSFEGLDRIKINIYISGDVSSYTEKTGITNTRYYKKKKNIRRSFVKNLSKIIKNRLKTDGHNFDVNLFKEIVLKSLAEIG